MSSNLNFSIIQAASFGVLIFLQVKRVIYSMLNEGNILSLKCILFKGNSYFNTYISIK